MSSIREVLEKVAKGTISATKAEKILQLLVIDEVGCLAKLDGNRELRKGIPEIVLAEGKTPADVAEISKHMVATYGRAIVSRCDKMHVTAIRKALQNSDIKLETNAKAKIAILKNPDFNVTPTGGRIGILTAGTSDIPVAEEAKLIAAEMGCAVKAAYDIGVAGIHRLLEPLKEIIAYDVDAIVDTNDALKRMAGLLGPADIVLLLTSGELGGLIGAIPKLVEQTFPATRQ